MSLLDRAENALDATSKLTPDTVEEKAPEIQQEAETIKEEIDLITDELTGVTYSPEKPEEYKGPKFTKKVRSDGRLRTVVYIEYHDEELENEVDTYIIGMQNAVSYEEYSIYRDKFKSIFNVPKKTTLFQLPKQKEYNGETFLFREVGKLEFVYASEANPVNMNNKFKLIHTTPEKSLIKELKPTWKSKDGYFYANQRVFF